MRRRWNWRADREFLIVLAAIVFVALLVNASGGYDRCDGMGADECRYVTEQWQESRRELRGW